MAQGCDSFDTVVVGGGITGAWAARRLAEAGDSVAVLEARQAWGGTAGHGAHLAILGTPEPYARLQARVGDAKAREIWVLTHENLQLLDRQLSSSGLQREPRGSLRLCAGTLEAEELERSAAELAPDGIEVELRDAADYGYLVGLATQGDLVFEPSALTKALLSHPGITLALDAQVNDIQTDRQDGIAIWAHQRFLRARRAILANGIHAIHLSRTLSAFLHPRYTHTVDLEVSRTLDSPLLMDEGHGAILPLADGWRLFGWAESEAEALDRLAAAASRFCPQAAVRSRTSEWVAQSDDGLPVVGLVPDLPATYVVGGLGAWGLSWVGVAVDRLAGLVEHGIPAGIFDIARFLPT